MPTIQSKKYDNVQFVDVETWSNWVETGRSRHFKVIDDGDMADTVIGTPEQIIEFADTEIPEPVDTVEKVLSREEIKAELDKQGWNYNPRASTVKLLELLNDNL